MPTGIVRRSRMYGYPNPQTGLQQEPIVMQRAPTTSDAAELGVTWVNSVAGTAYILANITTALGLVSYTWLQVSAAGGAGVFSSLTVNPGPTALSTVGNGAVSIGNATNTGAITLTVGTGDLAIVGGGNQIGIGNDLAANSVFLGSSFGAAETVISGGTGEILLNAVGNVSMIPFVPAPIASPTAAVVSDKRVAYATFTGFTTAAAGSQAFTITNALVTTASALFITVANGGANDAQMTVTRVQKNAGSFVVTLVNNGAAALNGDVTITWWVMAN